MIDITAEQENIISQILDRYVPDREVAVLGSRTAGTTRPYSDLDMAIMGSQPIALRTLALLKDAFAESDLPFRIDIIQWCRTSREFRKLIEPMLQVIHPSSC
jgi:predicted nucleotidyltransferase